MGENAESGLQHLRGEAYDLLLTDLGLPDASLAMIDQAKAEGRLADALIVVCTANNWLRRQALDRGAIFILKPVNVAEVAAAVRSADRREPRV